MVIFFSKNEEAKLTKYPSTLLGLYSGVSPRHINACNKIAICTAVCLLLSSHFHMYAYRIRGKHLCHAWSSARMKKGNENVEMHDCDNTFNGEKSL